MTPDPWGSPVAPAATLRVLPAALPPHRTAGAVGTEVEVDANIFVANLRDRLARGIHNHERNNELVGDAVVVALGHARNRIRVRAALRLARDHGVECLALALPPFVAVHGDRK